MSPLDPRILLRLGPLPVRARKVMEGLLVGLHQSPAHGPSIEFAEHKEYAAGDEIRHIDWRAYAKLDKYYVKRYQMETNLRALLVVDASGSMAYGRGALRKLDYAALCAGALAALLIRQADQVGLLVAGAGHDPGERLPAGVHGYLPPGGSSAHLQELLRRLEAIQPQGPTTLGPAIAFAAEKLGRRALIFVLSDLFDAEGQVLADLRLLRTHRHDVRVLQLLDREELEFPFEDPTRFLSLEDDRQLDVQPREIRESYLSELRTFLSRVRGELTRDDVDHELAITDEPPDQVLLRCLRRAKGRAA